MRARNKRSAEQEMAGGKKRTVTTISRVAKSVSPKGTHQEGISKLKKAGSATPKDHSPQDRPLQASVMNVPTEVTTPELKLKRKVESETKVRTKKPKTSDARTVVASDNDNNNNSNEVKTEVKVSFGISRISCFVV